MSKSTAAFTAFVATVCLSTGIGLGGGPVAAFSVLAGSANVALLVYHWWRPKR